MKKEFSKKWKASKKPKKQRKYLANAPLHIRKKFVSVNLSKELRKKYSKRNIPARKGDTVKVLRGKFKRKSGKIVEIKLKSGKITVEGMQVKKRDGSNVNVKLQPSNLQITSLNLEDKKRAARLGAEVKKIVEKTEEKKAEAKVSEKSKFKESSKETKKTERKEK